MAFQAGSLTKLYEKPEKLEILKEAIREECLSKCDIKPGELWIDLPKTPTFKEGSQCPVRVPGAPDTVRLRDVFPVEEWTTAFAQNKWQGFVFCPPEHRKVVHQAAKGLTTMPGGFAKWMRCDRLNRGSAVSGRSRPGRARLSRRHPREGKR